MAQTLGTLIEFTDNELRLIYKLCEQATVQGLDTARTLVSVIEKIQTITASQQLPEGQTLLPVSDE